MENANIYVRIYAEFYTPKNAKENVKKMQHSMSKYTSSPLPEHMRSRVPEDMMDRMSKYMVNKLPEYMLNRIC